MNAPSSKALDRPSKALQTARLHQQVVSVVSSSPWVRQGDIANVSRLLTAQVGKLLGIERVSVWLFNERKDELICQDLFLLSCSSHESGAVLKQTEFVDEFTYLVNSKFVDAHDPFTDPRTRGYVEGYLRPNRITSMLDAVVRIGEELIGTVCFEHVDQAHHWDDDEIIFSSQLGDQVALAVSIDRANAVTAALRERDLQLRELNERLEVRVLERTAALQSAREALLESERLSALGSIVAGVAHELNTPIGNVRVVATTISAKVKEFGLLVESGRVSKSALQAFMDEQMQCAQLVDRGLHQAAGLIASFKSVSTDQASGARRSFELDSVLHDVLEMMAPTILRSQCRVVINQDVGAGLKLDSYPGPLGQVVVNLINNSLLHAFEGREHGTINIRARRIGEDWAELLLSDDGCGIAADRINRVFEPFYTTKLGTGGSGLGLHLAYNIVTRNLGGKIGVQSVPGQGAAFRIELPFLAPLPTVTDLHIGATS